MHRFPNVFVVAVALALHARTAAAQSGGGGGACVMTTQDLIARGPRAGTVADQKVMRDRLFRVHEIVSAAPEIARRGNFRLSTVVSGARVGVFDFAWEVPAPLRGGYYRLSIYGPETWGDAGCTIRKYAGGDWTSQLFVAVNSITPLLLTPEGPLADDVVRDDSGAIYLQPPITGHLGGFPIYSDRVVFVTHVRRPPFVPVTVERVLRHMIAVYRAGATGTADVAASGVAQGDSSAAAVGEGVDQLAAIIKGMDAQADAMQATQPQTAAELRANAAKLREQLPALRQSSRAAADSIRVQSRRNAGTAQAMLPEAQERLRRLETWLASLSPEERRTQAWYGGEGADHELQLNRPGAPGAYALVSLNPDFFDLTAPRTAFQSLAFIAIKGNGSRDADSVGNLFARRLLGEIDFARVEALVR